MIVWIVAAVFIALILVCVIRAARATAIRETPCDVTQEDMARSEVYAAELARMLNIETVSAKRLTDTRKFYAFHALMKALFPRLHLECERHDFNGSLLFIWRGADSSAEPVLLLNHMDVVEAEASAWATPPFQGIIFDGRVYGRGAIDDKGPLYVMLRAAEELMATGCKPPCDVYFGCSCTEEIFGSGAPETAAFLQERGVRFRFALDEGGLLIDSPLKGIHGTYAMIGVTEKPHGNIQCAAHSKGGHSSTPPRGTPLVRLGRFMADVDRNPPFRPSYPPYFLEIIRVAGRSLPFPARIVTENLWLFRPLLPLITERVPLFTAMTRTTAAFTTAQGSDGLNVLPQKAYVTANMRYASHEPYTTANDALRKRAVKFGVELTVLDEGYDLPVADFNGAAYRLVQRTIEAICPGAVTMPYLVTGGTDSRFYIGLTDTVLRFAPLRADAEQLGSVHGVNENINVKALAGGVDFYKHLIQSL